MTMAATDADNTLNDTKLLKQVEFYFGDANLPRDKFIKQESALNDGWLNIETLLKFNRVLSLVNDIPADQRESRIAATLQQSELVDVHESGKKIRRNPEVPLPDGDSDERSIYIKGFHKTDTVLDELLELFAKYEGLEFVHMRYYKEKCLTNAAKNGSETKDDDKPADSEKKPETIQSFEYVRRFKGSLFVIFKTKEQAAAVLDDENFTSYKGTALIKQWLKDYKKAKNDDYKARIEARKQKNKPPKEEGDDEMETEAVTDEKAEEKPDKPDFSKGSLIKLADIPEGYTREKLKSAWAEAIDEVQFEICFVDFNKGDQNAVFRLERENSAQEALKLLPDGLKLEEVVVKLSEFTAEEEEEYFKKAQDLRMQRKRQFQGRNNSWGGRGGRGRGRGRGRGYGGGKRRRY